jgi:hypothetical protein
LTKLLFVKCNACFSARSLADLTEPLSAPVAEWMKQFSGHKNEKMTVAHFGVLLDVQKLCTPENCLLEMTAMTSLCIQSSSCSFSGC